MILDELVASTRAALPTRQAVVPLGALQERIAGMPLPNDLIARLDSPSVGVIAEVKRASPSKGALNVGLDPAALAASYARAGATGISVLTEPTRFLGNLEDLADVRQTVDAVDARLPLLRKDFIVDAYQLYEARAWGADAALLIVAALDDDELSALYGTARDLGLTPLIEVHDEVEMRRAARLWPPLIGINNRDLHTFRVDVATTYRLLALAPKSATIISESGIHTPQQMRELARHRVAGALIGEALVTAPDPATRLGELLEAGQWYV